MIGTKKLWSAILIIFGIVIFIGLEIDYFSLPFNITDQLQSKNTGLYDLTPFTDYEIARVVEVKSSGESVLGMSSGKLYLTARLNDTKELVVAEYDPPKGPSEEMVVRSGALVVLGVISSNDNEYVMVDFYRLNSLPFFLFIFLILTVIFAGWRGITALVGLAFSLFIIIYFFLPGILLGQDPFVLALFSVFLISVVSMYLAHGFNLRATLSLISTLITLFISQVLAVISTRVLDLSGLGNADSFYLQSTVTTSLDFEGLLLAGIMFGTLGVLDDVTTAQTATVEEISKVGNSLNLRALYKRGISVGKEHIASLVNTLALVYVSVSLPLLLLLWINFAQPLWVIFNSEPIVSELVRTLVGSSSIVLAVPVSTLLAATVYARLNKRV